ncbi:hypothetical protein HYS99_01855, partial [Candidatus Giovannonibacteria bacterium]|nr:hypothetical protein [Candidatus Giovannonibacteria bacterium]
MPIAISKKPDNTFEAVIDLMDENPQPQRFDIVDSEVNLLNVPLRTAASLYLGTDVPVSYSIEYTKDGLSINGSTEALRAASPWNYYNSIYGTTYRLGYVIPLKYDTRVKLTDSTGKVYYSPYINLGLEYTQSGASLIFKNSTLKWSIPPNIHLIYPNGGENLKPGTTEAIRWECVNLPPGYTCNPSVSIFLTGYFEDSGYYDFWGTYF